MKLADILPDINPNEQTTNNDIGCVPELLTRVEIYFGVEIYFDPYKSP